MSRRERKNMIWCHPICPRRLWKLRPRKSQISTKSIYPADEEVTQETLKRSGEFGAINRAFYCCPGKDEAVQIKG